MIRRILAALELILAKLYWPCLHAKQKLQDEKSNR